jgi:outer membrane protein OmpA-like peptidoglycan-associated protein
VNFAPNSQLESIGYGAFFRATALESIDIPSRVSVIDETAFYEATSLEFITFATSATPLSIGHYAFFANDLLESISFPSRVVSIGDYAFSSAVSLEEITFASNSQLQTIGAGAFTAAGALKSVTFAANSQLQTIGNFAFASARSLIYIEIPSSVISLGDSAFGTTLSLSSVTFAQNSLLTIIGEECFSGSALTTITIPSSVNSVGPGAFAVVEDLSSVYFLGDEPSTMGPNVFSAVAPFATAFVQANALGFEVAGDPARWKGLIVSRGTFTPPPTQAPTTPPATTPTSVPSINSSAAAVTKSASNLDKSIRFSTSSKVLTQAHKNALKKSFKASGKDATYVVTGNAGFLPGVTEAQVKKLARVRANIVRDYLVKLGVNRANITIKITTTNRGIVPKTKTLARFLG